MAQDSSNVVSVGQKLPKKVAAGSAITKEYLKVNKHHLLMKTSLML